jgi:hypothetical protein
MLRNRGVLAVVLVLIVTSCAPSASVQGVQRSPLETAKLAYADSSIGYEALMESVVAARAAHRISDEQWKKVEEAQRIVQVATPRLRSALNLWEASGTKPPTYTAAITEIAEAIQAISTISAEVKR